MAGVHFDDGDEILVPETLAHANSKSASTCSDGDDRSAASVRQAVQRRGRAALFVDSDDEEFFSRGTEHVRTNKGRTIGARNAYKVSTSKKPKTNKAAGKRAASDVGHLSHLSAALEDKDHVQPSDPTGETSTPELLSNQGESDSLFISEDDDKVEIALIGTTNHTRPISFIRGLPYMDGLQRARNIKAEIENNISVLQPQDKKTSTRRHVEDDPENQIIKTLRQEQHMNWNDIANFLNQERRNRGEAANFTDAAVYSRFVRNAPRIAVAVGEIGFDPKDYMHLRHPNQYTQVDGTGTISKAGKKRVKNYDNATELRANMRKQVKLEDHGELETAEKTEQLMEAVAKVERNFWLLVADEMERATTKFYEPNQLASRYHAI